MFRRRTFKIPVGILSYKEAKKLLEDLKILFNAELDIFAVREWERKELLKNRKQKLDKLFK